MGTFQDTKKYVYYINASLRVYCNTINTNLLRIIYNLSIVVLMAVHLGALTQTQAFACVTVV